MGILKQINEERTEGKENSFSFAKINRLVIHLSECIKMIPIEKIEFIKAEGNYSNIHLTDGTTILSSKTLKKVTESLGDSFIRTHKSYFINLNYVSQYNTRDSQIVMDSNKVVLVSRAKKATLREIFK